MQQQATKARFDGQLPPEQKEYFEQAAEIGGFRTLTEFVFSSAQEKADEIIERHKMLLETERDREVFFYALINPPEPNEKLQQTAQKHNEEINA
ncbi:MAG: DUF1778 domain-containing protein [Alphaproteobacteria bacterium]|nr:DUF1778 domain-containing protein [Alphaproteobacteria bacterium]